MKKESLDEYRNNITMHLTRISGDLGHIKEKVNENNRHLEMINGRLRKAENHITGIKAIGITLYSIIAIILTLLGVEK